MKSSKQYMNHSFGFLNIIGKEIWLTDYSNPSNLFTVNDDLSKLTIKQLLYPKSFNRSSKNVSFENRQWGTYITNGKGQIAYNTPSVNAQFDTQNIVFDEPLSISPTTLITRVFKNDGMRQTGLELTKINLSRASTVTKKFLLPKQIDGVICADGLLTYDFSESKIYYMYFHRGQFLCLDTNLSQSYAAKTIDTIKFAQINLVSFKKKLKRGTIVKKLTDGNPSRLVNRYFSVDKGFIYILSGLKGDNESEQTMKVNEPIDVYSTNNGIYLHSFYLPKFKGYRLRQFKVSDGKLFALYREHIVYFDIKI